MFRLDEIAHAGSSITVSTRLCWTVLFNLHQHRLNHDRLICRQASHLTLHTSHFTPHTSLVAGAASGQVKKTIRHSGFHFPLLSLRTAHTATRQQPCLCNQHSTHYERSRQKTLDPSPFPHNPFPFPHNPFTFPHNPFTFPPPSGGAQRKNMEAVPLKSKLRVVMRHSVKLMAVTRQRHRDGRRVTVSMMLYAQHII